MSLELSALSKFASAFILREWYLSPAQVGRKESNQLKRFCMLLLRSSKVPEYNILYALYLCTKLVPHIKRSPNNQAKGCGCRLFLMSLILVDKIVNDKAYTNVAWSNISLVSLEEISAMEREYLGVLGFQVWLSFSCLKRFLLGILDSLDQFGLQYHEIAAVQGIIRNSLQFD